MKGRDSGMPGQEMWEGFFDPSNVLSVIEVSGDAGDVAEFGCGYGTFTIPAAKIVSGTVYAFDIEKEMTVLTEREANRNKLHNIKTILRDFMIIEQAENFDKSSGKIYACGSCIKLRNQGGTEMCPISTMKDMYDIVKESDKVVTF
ncbi:MAG: class I SAM-dependent methyltransferase [Candidatus Omnitrophica bacterium]|nr:class I SAM-dependent methyltransferase [Candidatus Omnitrophota bacterium]